MLDLEPPIQDAYDRAIQQAYDLRCPARPGCLDIFDVLRAHFLIANHFFIEGEGIGGIGPRDFGLLESAIHRQTSSFGGKDRWTDNFDICATLFFGLIKNHPFYDANKRTAFLSLLFQLEAQGWSPSVPERNVEDFTVEIAENKLVRYRRFRDLDGPDPEVRFISYWIRSKFRKIDRTNRAITYKELKKIINRYGYSLENPRGNYIDVVKFEMISRSFLGLFRKDTEQIVKVGQIGFPRWTAQIRASAVKSVREMTGLTYDRGVDSRAFYEGLDPLQSLITTYHEPLRRLAGR